MYKAFYLSSWLKIHNNPGYYCVILEKECSVCLLMHRRYCGLYLKAVVGSKNGLSVK